MPQQVWLDTGRVRNGEPVLKRSVGCSRDRQCDFNNPSTNVVREHEKEAHPREGDNEPPPMLTNIRPDLRRK